MWQRWLVIGLVLVVIGVVIFEESTTPYKTIPPPKQEQTKESPDNDNAESEDLSASSGYQDAEFPGGKKGMNRWLGEHINYPQVAVELGLEGKAYVQFIVDKNGDVRRPVILKGVPDCPECDQEVIRVINLMPRWKPARDKGRPVSSVFNLPISFRLQ